VPDKKDWPLVRDNLKRRYVSAKTTWLPDKDFQGTKMLASII
jgi:hypothetical protein